MSDNGSYVGFANTARYSAATFTLMGFSEALAEDTNPFGVRVAVLPLGQFRTSLMDQGSMTFAKNKTDVYAEAMWRSYSVTQAGDPEKLINVLMAIADSPPLHCTCW